MRKPTPEEIDRAIDTVRDFMHGVAYHLSWSSSNRMFSDLLRTRPIQAPERIGRIAGAIVAEVQKGRN